MVAATLGRRVLGGSAAALAAGLVPLATGSDGGGSIRIPAAVTGLTGLKPSLGRADRRAPAAGLAAAVHPGPMTRAVRDLALALDVVVGPEPSDLASLPLPDASWSRSLGDLGAPRRVAWSPALGYGRTDSEVVAVCEEAVRRLESLGTEVIVVDEVWDRDPIDDWLAMTGVYCLREIDAYRGTEVWARIDPGLVALADWARSSVTATRLAQALDASHRYNLALVDLFHQVRCCWRPPAPARRPGWASRAPSTGAWRSTGCGTPTAST